MVGLVLNPLSRNKVQCLHQVPPDTSPASDTLLLFPCYPYRTTPDLSSSIEDLIHSFHILPHDLRLPLTILLAKEILDSPSDYL
ncbi:hypothetical protein E2C01_053810 [Portunus trituberculatus]|uniref:Uncharacterized protein n=1 Tax=Portunus trituberculatus TaxID=210409 RepID=A0A5B7GLB7_PORTR|nr:hypothetical protein [Portunus trituberculatus]